MSHTLFKDRFADILASRFAGKPFILDEDGVLSLCFDITAVQSQMNPAKPDSLTLGYTRTMMGCLLFNPKPKHITMLGLGGGSLAKYCHRYLADANITAVEINPDIIALRNTFAIPNDSSRFHIHCGDGAEFIANPPATTDLLMVDGFDVTGQAPSLCTQRFYNDCYKALGKHGILVVNMCGDGRQIALYVSRIRHSFANSVVVIPSEDCDNQIVFAVKGDGLRYSEKQLLAQARYLEQCHPIALQNTARRLTASQSNGGFLPQSNNHANKIHSQTHRT